MVHTDELGGFQLLEVRSSLPDELLMYADKLSMAHSLEVRVPYLDRSVVEYVQRLGAGFKIRNGSRKWLHRRVCQSYLPKSIMKRKKRGFAVNVVDEWLRSSRNGGLSDVLLDRGSLMFELLKPERVQRLFQEHRTRRKDNHKLLFSLIMLEQWLRRVRASRSTRAQAPSVAVS
jgi:asparagine synthase (glutamine-hydrolysing)